MKHRDVGEGEGNVLRLGEFLAQIPTDTLCFFWCRMRVSDGKKVSK